MKADTLPTEIKVVLPDRDRPEVTLEVVEFHPVEPSAYCLDPGYTAIECYPEREIEYFVSLDGTVYRQPENKEVGHAPKLREAAEKMERETQVQEERHDHFDDFDHGLGEVDAS